MPSEVQGFRGWLLHLYPDLRHKSAFLKSGYALRSGVGVGLFAVCRAIFQHESDRRGGNSTLLQWSQGCLWGAITVLTVNFPIMGRIAKQSFERGLGTVVGGWLGYAAYIVSQHPSVEVWEECWLTIISFLFAFAAFLIGVKLKLDYSAKLLGVTFVLVLWTPQSEEQALDVAASRITCIVIAVLVMAVLSILIYPQIASELVMGEMHSAMQSIADFNRIVWDEVNQTCKEESDRISRSFHLRNTARKGITDVQANSLDPPKGTYSGPHTGSSMCESLHDSRGAIDHSTAGAKECLTASKQGQHSLADCRADAEKPGIHGAACSADAGGSSGQHSSLDPQAGTLNHRQCSLNGDSSTGLAANSPYQKRQGSSDDNTGNSDVHRWQEQQQRRAQEDAFEEATRAHQVDSEVRDGEAALVQPWTKAYFELDRERPFFDALGDFRGHIGKCEEHVATALSEIYVGRWAGRRWFFPTIFYQNSLRHGTPGWHIPEQALKGVQTRMQRTVRVLYMIHCTFRDGFQGEVLEELQHHYPLDLLMALSEAAVGAMQEFVDSFPDAFVSPRQLMPAKALIRLNEVTNELMELARASRANKVDLILMGEHYRRMLEQGVDPLQHAPTDSHAPGFTDELPGMRVLANKLRDPQSSSGFEAHGLFLFPNTDAGWLATTRWYSFHFLVQQLVGALVRLRISLNKALPLLPGADIHDVPQCSEGRDGGQDELVEEAEGSRKRQRDVQIAVE